MIRGAQPTGERGVALYSVLVIVIMVGASVTAMLEVGRRVPADAMLARARAGAQAAAEGGVEFARAHLAEGKPPGSYEVQCDDAAVTVDVEALEPDAAGGARWSVRSVAQLKSSGERGLPVQAAVRVRLVERDALPSVESWQASPN